MPERCSGRAAGGGSGHGVVVSLNAGQEIVHRHALAVSLLPDPLAAPLGQRALVHAAPPHPVYAGGGARVAAIYHIGGGRLMTPVAEMVLGIALMLLAGMASILLG